MSRAKSMWTHLLAPGSLQSLEPVYITAVEGIESVDQPLPVGASQGLQHRVHELWGWTGQLAEGQLPPVPLPNPGQGISALANLRVLQS